MDQSNRYADLSLKEEDLIKGDKHVLVAYQMEPATGYGYLEVAAHIAAESSTGTNVEVSTTDDFTKGVDALVYFIDEAKGVMKVAYPNDLFDRNLTDGRAMLVSFLTLALVTTRAWATSRTCKCRTSTCRGRMLRQYDGPSKDISDCGTSSVVRASMAATSPAPSSSRSSACARSRSPRRPTSSGSAATSSRTTNRKATRCSARPRRSIPLVYDAMKRAMDETGQAKLFSANITADDHYEMLARADYILETFGPDADKVAFLVDGYVGGPGMITTARRQYPAQYLHYHRAGHGAITSPRPSAATPPSCCPRCPVCKVRPVSTSAPWVTARWKVAPMTAISPT